MFTVQVVVDCGISVHLHRLIVYSPTNLWAFLVRGGGGGGAGWWGEGGVGGEGGGVFINTVFLLYSFCQGIRIWDEKMPDLTAMREKLEN